MPVSPLAAYRIVGTRAEATRDIRLLQAFGGGLGNLYHDERFQDWNDTSNLLRYEQLPKLDHIRIEGGLGMHGPKFWGCAEAFRRRGT